MTDSGSAMTCDEDHDHAAADSGPRVNNASRLPTDVYLEIFDIMKPRVTEVAGFLNPNVLSNMETFKRDLSNWALTSRSFRNICQQRVFEYIHFVGDGYSNQGGSAHADFCREIASGNESARTFASYVKKCRIECWNAPWSSLEQSALDFLTFRIQVVACMTNLETLLICSTPVTKELLEVIGSLKLLKSCSFYDSSFTLVLPDDIRPDLFSSTLTSLTLSWPHGSAFLSKPLVGTIPASLKFLRADSQEFIKELINSPHISSLVELELRLFTEQLEDLGRFLTRLHSLRRLVLYSIEWNSQISPYHLNLPPSAIPVLTNVRCLPQLALELVKGRPVKSLTLDGEPTLVEAFTALKYSTAKDQSLEILNPSVETLQLLPSIDCPRLTSLRISTAGMDEETLENVLHAICRIWQQSLSLHSLYIQNSTPGATYNLPHHNMLISQVIESFPALMTVSFMHEIVWQYTESSGCWKPVIHRDSRDDLRRHIMKYGTPGVTVDFEGCYADLFTEDELNDVLPKLRAS